MQLHGRPPGGLLLLLSELTARLHRRGEGKNIKKWKLQINRTNKTRKGLSYKNYRSIGQRGNLAAKFEREKRENKVKYIKDPRCVNYKQIGENRQSGRQYRKGEKG